MYQYVSNHSPSAETKYDRRLTVETSVTARQPFIRTEVPMDVELCEAVHALELLEPVQGHFAGTCDKLQQFGLFFLVKAADRTPKPLHLWRRLRVIVVVCIVLPVVSVNLRQTRNQQLKLLLVENGDELARDNLLETYAILVYI